MGKDLKEESIEIIEKIESEEVLGYIHQILMDIENEREIEKTT